MGPADDQPRPGPIAIALGPFDSRGLLRPATIADTPFVRALFHADRAPQFAGVPQPLLATLLDQQLRAQQIGYRQAFPDAEHLIVIGDGHAVGRIIVACAGEGDRRALHIVDILMIPEARGRGLGTEILTALGRTAVALGATSMRLAVLATNLRARQLYDRLGFVATGDDGVRIAMARSLVLTSVRAAGAP